MITREYKTLCDVVIRHGFYLNDGTKDFDAMTPDAQKLAMKRYDFAEAITISPIEATSRTMKNQNAFFRKHSDRVFLAVKTEGGDARPLIPINDDQVFVFLVKTADPVFQQLTDNQFDSSKLFLFTNCQPAELPDTTVTQLPKINQAVRITDNFQLSAADSKILLDKFTGPLDRFGLIGLLYIRVKGTGAGNNLLNTSGETVDNYPQFKIHFNNTSTYWKYKKPSAGFEATTSNPKPLTKYGFIKITPEEDFPIPYPPASYKYPNPRPEIFEITPAKTYSVIFI